MPVTEEVRLTMTAAEFNRVVDQVEAKFAGATKRMEGGMQGIAASTRMVGKLMGGLGMLALVHQVMSMAERLAALSEAGAQGAGARRIAELGGSRAGEAAALMRASVEAQPPGLFAPAGHLLSSVAQDFLGSLTSLFSSSAAQGFFDGADEAWRKMKEATHATSELADSLKIAAEQRASFEAGQRGAIGGLESEALALGDGKFVQETRKARQGMEDAAREAEYLREAIKDLREKLTKSATDFGPAPMILGPGQ